MKLPLSDKKFIFLLIAVALSIGLEVLSITGTEVPMPYAPYLYAVFVLIVGHNVLRNGLKALLQLNFSSINLLMLIAVCAAFYLGEYPEASVVTVLYVLGEKLEDIGIGNSMSALESLVGNAPKTATVKDQEENVPVDQIAIGTIIRVKPHDMIPLDGVVQSGETAVDESSITGEPVPAEKYAGDLVFAGTLNLKGYIEVKTSKTVNNTTFAKIVEMTYQAQSNQSNVQQFIEKFARIYTPSVIGVALLVFLIPTFVLGRDLNHWLNQAITLLVISCPCALVISTPVAIYAAISCASSKGALVKGGKYIEILAGIRAIGLDKTRTITYGKPVVSDVIPLNGADREELLACSAGTELFSEHPLAQAIVEAARKEGLDLHAAKKFESIAGKGAKAICLACDDSSVLVGRLNFIAQHHPVGKETEELVTRFAAEGKTCVVVSCNEEVKGVIALTDEIKPDSAEAIRGLKSLGITPVMLSGDSQQAAGYIASQAGIQLIHGGLLPQDKVAVIKKLQMKYRSVGMVGDGINDAPALAESAVGIAMGAAGSDTAIEVANIALMNDQLSLIPFLVRLSRQTAKTIRYNIIGAIVVKLIFILLAIYGFSHLALAIAADVGVTLLVIWISLRLVNFK